MTRHVWDGDLIVLELSGANVVQLKYIRGINLLYADGGTQTWYLYNGHGDVVQLTDTSGNAVKSYDYDAFGVEKNPDENDTNVFRYCGEYFDKETGTIYLRARYYNPEIGRFITEDSVWGEADDPLSLNLYTYCHNDPVNSWDPSGHIPVETIPDILSIGWSAVDFIKKPSWGNLGFLMWDIGATILPYVPGSWTAKGVKVGTKLLSKADKVTDTVKAIKKSDGVADAAKDAVEGAGKGTNNPAVKEAAAKGRQMHKDYDYGPGVQKEKTLPSGKRMDGYDAGNKTIHELKPNNPNAIKKGMKQLDGYIEEANKVYSPEHSGKLHTYDK